MPKKVYTIAHLDCANCAAKMQARICALPEVEAATITFATRQLTVTAADPDALLPRIRGILASIEPEAHILQEEAHHHHHHHEEEKNQLPFLLAGGVLFLAGLLLPALWGKLAFLAAYLLLGAPVLLTAGKNLLRGHIFDENFLMSLATLGAFAIGEFPEAVGIMLFYRIGEYFEHKAVERSRSQILEAVDLRPETVCQLHGSHTHLIPAAQAQPGDLLLVRPGDRIPLDSTVVSGESRIDTSPITGEPVPVAVKPGDAVTSGCINTLAQLTVRVEKPLSESMVSRILRSVESAAAGKPKIDRFITRFSRIYTPVVVLGAAATALIPSLITGNWSYWVYTALSFLVMSCPCALVLSVPLAFFSGIGLGSRKGILFKGGASMEALAGIRLAALDKTGTITQGNFRVQDCQGRQDVLHLSACCELNSTHPIAVSIVAEARARGLSLSAPEKLCEIPGHGIEAFLHGKTYLCGNRRLMDRFGVATPDSSREDSTVFLAEEGVYIGCITICDTLKPEAPAAVAALSKMGIHVAMLTGDSQTRAAQIASQTGISSVRAGLLPEDKLEALRQLRKEQGAALFVGDGINDAPVLAGADVGAAMGSGADAAIEAADVVFLHNNLLAVPEAVGIARRTRQIAWQNVIFALGIKALVMVLGLLGYASMWMAVFADSGVAMLCVLNSIRMLYRRGG